jgi:hypothetical protein
MMPKTNWLKMYRKSKEPLVDLVDIAGAMMSGVAAPHRGPKDYYNTIKFCDSKANEMAALHKVLVTDEVGEWKLSRNWFRMMLLQVMFRGIEKEESLEYNIEKRYTNFKPDKGEWIEKAKFLYADLGWNYRESLVPVGDDQRTVEELFYVSTEEQKEYFKVLLEPVGVFTVGSKWVSSKNKVWICDGIENGFVLFSADEAVNGKHKTLKLAPVIARRMRKI